MRIRQQDASVWITLCGEVDLDSHSQLLEALAEIHLNGAGVVHLDLSELTFCDVRGVSYLLDFARQVRDAGRELVTHDAPPTVQKVAQILAAPPVASDD